MNTNAVPMKLGDADYRDRLQRVQAELVFEEEGVGRDRDLLKYAQKNFELQLLEVRRLQSLESCNLIAWSQLDSAYEKPQTGYIKTES